MLSCRRADNSVAALLDENADLMVLPGGDPFRTRVYNKVTVPSLAIRRM